MKPKKEFADVHAPYDKFLTLLRSQLKTFELDQNNTNLQRLRTEYYGVAWIMYMRFRRRSEGMKSFHGVFGKARRIVGGRVRW